VQGGHQQRAPGGVSAADVEPAGGERVTADLGDAVKFHQGSREAARERHGADHPAGADRGHAEVERKTSISSLLVRLLSERTNKEGTYALHHVRLRRPRRREVRARRGQRQRVGRRNGPAQGANPRLPSQGLERRQDRSSPQGQGAGDRRPVCRNQGVDRRLRSSRLRRPRRGDRNRLEAPHGPLRQDRNPPAPVAQE